MAGMRIGSRKRRNIFVLSFFRTKFVRLRALERERDEDKNGIGEKEKESIILDVRA